MATAGEGVANFGQTADDLDEAFEEQFAILSNSYLRQVKVSVQGGSDVQARLVGELLEEGVARSRKLGTLPWDASLVAVVELKIGAGELQRDLGHVIAIKQALGDCASVRVDVNQGWDESQAIRACQVLGDNGIDLIEQPIARINRAGQVRLNQRSPAPIMADESIESVEDAFSLAADGAASVFALKIAKNGGPRAVLRTAAIAESAGIALYGGTMLEGSIGTLASAHAFLTLNKLTWHTELFGPLLLTEEIVQEAPQYRDFQLHVPRTPGLGLTLDEERLAFFRRP